MTNRIAQLQQIVKNSKQLAINTQWLDYAGIVEYHPEELVITVRAGTKIADIQTELAKNQQILPFFIKTPAQSMGAAYVSGGQDLSDVVLGVQIIDGNGEVLNFGGQVMKNVAGYDVARLLVGSKGRVALITQISLKVLPKSYVKSYSSKPSFETDNKTDNLVKIIEQKLKSVFDPRGIFQ